MNDSSQSGLGPEETFNRARDEFLAGLSDQDRLLYSPCASPNDLLAAVEKLNIITQSRDRRHQDRAKRWIGTISKFSTSLAPYLSAIDVFVSSNPEYAALVWGSLRLILQLASNYTEFFDKLTQLLFSLSKSFEQYQRILVTIHKGTKGSEIVKKCVGEVYVILLEIFHSAVRVFTKSDGKLKRTSIVIGQLMWKPFNVRFSDLVEKLKHRHKTLFEELTIIDLANQFHERENAETSRQEIREEQKRNQEERNAAATEREKAQKERMLADAERRDRGKLLSAARKGIHPPNYADARDRASSIRLDGTATWVFDTPPFKSWVGDSPPLAQSSGTFGSNVMWITGKPGAGKTVLAASTIEHLEDFRPQSDTLYFFFQSQSSENACSDAYRSILSQLIQKSGHDLDLLYKFSFALPKSDEKNRDPNLSGLSNDGQEKFTSTIILELLKLCLRRGSILVLDGIDECRDIDVFISSLWGLLETHPSTRVVLLSRINIPRLKRMVQSQHHLEFCDTSVSTDIGHFLATEIQEFFEDGLLPGSSENVGSLVQKLVRGADGMFLWARLMINLLRSPSMTPYQRLEVIERVSVPEGLEKLYERIFLYIASTGLRALNLASGCLAWLTKMVSPMSSFQLREALVIQGHLSSTAIRDSIVDFEEAVIMTCAGLVIRAPASHPQSPTILMLAHISIKEMVEELVVNRIWIDQYLNHGLHCIITDCSAARLDLANCCLRKILSFVGRNSSEDGDYAQETQSVTGLFTYASAYWLRYVKDSIFKCQPVTDMHPHVKSAMFGALSKLLLHLSDLLEKPRVLSSWLYEFYFSSSMEYHSLGTVLSSLGSWITQAWAGDIVSDEMLLDKLRTFDVELRSIITTWRDDIIAKPHILWDEMASFANSKLFFNPGATRFTNQNPQIPATQNNNNNHQKLVTLISKTTQNGMMNGVLSIWSSLPIHKISYYDSLQSNATLDLTELCSYWVVEYELWQLVPEPKRISNINLPMNQQDVVPVLHDWLDSTFEHGMRIPLEISCDLQSFSVVYTIFSQTPRQHLASPEWVSQAIPETLRPAQSHIYQKMGTWRMSTHYQYYSKVEFGFNGNYFALVESSGGPFNDAYLGEQRISVYRFNAAAALGLNIELIGRLTTDPGAERVKELLFHPFQEIMAFKISSKMEGSWKTYIRQWNFRQEFPGSITSHQVSMQWQLPRDWAFSSCGGYLAVTSTTKECIVIPLAGIAPIPSIPTVSDRKHINFSLCLSDNASWSRQALQSRNQSNSLVISNTQISGPHSQPQQRNMSVSLQGSDVVLSDGNKSTSKDVGLITLPNFPGIRQTSQCVRLPQDPKEPIGISIDVEPQYNQVISSNIPTPMYVERDPRMVLMRNRGNIIEGPHSLTFGVSGQVGRKRIMEDSESEETDSSKRRR